MITRIGLVAAALAVLFVCSRLRAEVEPSKLGLGAPFAPGKIMNGITRHRLLHFTFDDGPDAKTTPLMLDALDQVGVRATFFFSASRFADKSARNAHARELALLVQRRGHSIGSHSVDHKRMRTMTSAQLRDQLDRNDRLFTEIFGQRTFLFRPPWGSHSPELDAMLAERKNTMVLWNIGSADWTIFDADELESTFEKALPYLERTKSWGGGIVLMHDTHPWTVQAFPRIVAALRAKNCALLATDQELYDIADDLALWDPALAPATLEAELRRRQGALREATKLRCAKN